MGIKKRIFSTILPGLLVVTPAAESQGTKLKLDTWAVSTGAGPANFKIMAPESANFRTNQGLFVSLTGEKALNVFNLYLNLTLSYLWTTGNVNYAYTSSTPTIFTATNAAFKADLFHTGVGLKWKIVDNSWIRPYLEVGGVGGYFYLKYTDLQNMIVPSTPPEYRVDDSLIDLGKYGEGGVEMQFSDRFGIRAAMRVIDSQTKKFDTLGKAAINYSADVYYLSFLALF